MSQNVTKTCIYANPFLGVFHLASIRCALTFYEVLILQVVMAQHNGLTLPIEHTLVDESHASL
jgi:hypothetical protein